MTYKIGQILKIKKDIKLKGFNGNETVIPRGCKIIIGADKMAHHFRGGYIQLLPNGTEVSGYDSTGLADYIYRWLNCSFGLNSVLEDNCIDITDFKEQIKNALDEIDM